MPALDRIGWNPVLFVDPNLERARQLAGNEAIPALDHTEYLEDFDAVLVLVPHVLHGPLASTLLEQGKAVLVEKPMAMSQAEAERMVATSASTGSPLAVGLMRRHLHAAQWLKGFLDGGHLGKIQSFDVRDGFVYEWMVVSDAIWRKEKAGGGVLMDVGVHVLDLLLWWLGPARDVAYKDDSYGGVEADCWIDLVMESGASGIVELSRTRNLRQSAIIRGERGLIEIGVDTNLLRAEPGSLLSRRINGVRGRSIKGQTSEDLFDAQLRDWRRVLQEGADPAVPGEEAAAAVALIENSYSVRRTWNLPWVNPNG